ncbi:MAG TPA: GYF domain-containing protein, partial [Polyangia bacterium]|nr:GYF domain-containing protein [Polyangia bacterium]
MKIVCDSCGTKYSIADEKVRGKVFKIRCKKCSHIIVVRGTNEAAAAATPAAAPTGDAGGWHLVVDGDQVGPVPESDIRARLERGEINADTYVWKEGFADWLKLSAIPELASLVQPVEGGVFADGTGSGAVNGDAAAHPSGPAAGGLFGGAAPAGDEADVFGGLGPAAAKRGGGGDLFASPAVVSKPAAEEARWPAASAAPAGHDGGRVENLTGQRHENSVLFSLSNLQSLAMPAPVAAKPSLASSAPTSEGSGLIDIRAMAATTLGSSSSAGSSFGGGGPVDDLPAFGAFSPAVPMLALPTRSGPSKLVIGGIVALGVLFIGVIVMAVMVFSSKPAAPVAVAPAAAPGAPAAAPGA